MMKNMFIAFYLMIGTAGLTGCAMKHHGCDCGKKKTEMCNCGKKAKKDCGCDPMPK